MNIQALRGLAALLVVFVHLKGLGVLGGASVDAFLWGNTGVDLFFVISGLIMVQTTSQRTISPGVFLRHRAVRVAPLYWAVTIATFGLAVVAPSLVQTTDADGWKLLKSLSFIPYARQDGSLDPVVFLGWTLNYEMAFYVLFALGLTAKTRALQLAGPIVILSAFVVAGVLWRPADPILRFYTAPIVLEFASGMIIGAVLRRPAETRRTGVIALACAGAALAAMLAGPYAAPGIDRALKAGIPATIIVGGCLLAERSGLVVRVPLLRRLGDASYSIYLTHFFVTASMTKLAAHFNLTALPLLLGMALAALVLVVLLGLAVHVWIEIPLTRLFRQGLDKTQPLKNGRATPLRRSEQFTSQLPD